MARFIRPEENSIFKINGTKSIKLLIHLLLNFSYLNKQTFNFNTNKEITKPTIEFLKTFKRFTVIKNIKSINLF